VYLMRNSVDFFPQSSTKFFNLIFVPLGVLNRGEVYAIGGAPSGGGLCYGGEFLLRRVV
jgi:hypothetical protein